MERFPLTLTWSGSTTTRDYPRAAVAGAPGKPSIAVSASPTYGGDAAAWNPEDLLGASLFQCHLLTFLALAAKAGIDVREVDGHAEVELGTVERVTKVVRIWLRPRIVLGEGADVEKARGLFEKAHRYCFIANSLTAEVVMEPEIVAGE